MSWRDANPTSHPNGCLWCGTRLRRPSTTEWASAEGFNPPTRCSGCSGLYDDVNGDWEPDPDGSEGEFRCRACRTDGQHGTPKRRVVKRVPRHERAGDYGDGHFCGLRCGYQFGVALANAGRRLKRTQ
ncbi:MAG: hypothetical protein RLO52_41160 [Sandaracinaceae bacterium]